MTDKEMALLKFELQRGVIKFPQAGSLFAVEREKVFSEIQKSGVSITDRDMAATVVAKTVEKLMKQYRSIPTITELSPSVKIIMDGISVEQSGFEKIVKLPNVSPKNCTIVQKGYRSTALVTSGVQITPSTEFRIGNTLQLYGDERFSVAAVWDDVAVALAYADSGEGIKGKSSYKKYLMYQGSLYVQDVEDSTPDVLGNITKAIKSFQQNEAWAANEDCSEIAHKLKNFFAEGNILTICTTLGNGQAIEVTPENLSSLGVNTRLEYFDYPFYAGGTSSYIYHTVLLMENQVVDGTAPSGICVRSLPSLLKYLTFQYPGRNVYYWKGEYYSNPELPTLGNTVRFN